MEDAKCSAHFDSIWVNLKEKITWFANYNKILFNNIIIYQCVTNKNSKIMALDSIRIPEMFQEKRYFNVSLLYLPRW